MLTADHIFTCLFTLVLRVLLSSVFCLSIFEFAFLFLDQLTRSRPVPGTATPTHTPWMWTSLLLPPPYVCMTGNLAMVAAGPLGTPIVAHYSRGWQRGKCTRKYHLCSYSAPCTAPHTTAERWFANQPADLLTHDLGCGSQICIMGWPFYSADRRTVSCVFQKKEGPELRSG